MAKAEQLNSGHWRAVAYLGLDTNGKRIRKSFTAKTKKEAERLADTCRIDFERNQQKHQNPVEKMTLGEAMLNFLDLRKESLEHYTLKGYQTIQRNHFQDIQGLKLCQLTNELIQKSLNQSALRPSNSSKSKKGLSRKTLSNARGFLSVVLETYYPDFHLKVSIPKGRQKTQDEKPVQYSPEQVFNLVRGSNIELPVLLGLLSFRCEEIFGFRKSDCDLENGYITVNQVQIIKDGLATYRPYGKTEKSNRTVALPKYVIQLIRNLPEEQEYLVPEKQQTITKRWARLQDKSDFKGKPLSFHGLRHVHASITKSLGIDDMIRQDMGGWSTPVVMNGVYTTIFSEDRQAADKKVLEFFDQLTSID